MSDYGDYGEYAEDGEGYYNYEEEDPNQMDEDYETNVQLAFFQAEELLRKGADNQCVESLQQIYTTAQTHNLKNWKVKILNLLLQIYCKKNQANKIKEILEKISQLNKKEKYSENAIKSIIMTVKSLPSESYEYNKEIVFEFIDQLDPLGKIRSYLLFLQKVIEEKNKKQTEKLLCQIEKLINVTPDVPPNTVIEYFSLQIRYSLENGIDISKKLRKMQLRLSSLEAEAYMSQGHLSVIKQALAAQLYKEVNYKECAAYLCEAFQQYVKYGKSTEHKKKILKANVLISLLTNDVQTLTDEKYNCLFHESAAFFRADNDIQQLYGMIECFKSKNIIKFMQILQKSVKDQQLSGYKDLKALVFKEICKNKIVEIIQPYSKIKLSHLAVRLGHLQIQKVQEFVFELLCQENIIGRIRKTQTAEVYLDINFQSDQLLSMQRKNIRLLQGIHF